MPKIIFLISLGVVAFAGYTVWNDPFTGPRLRSYLPDNFHMPVVASSQRSNTPMGGVGAANGVAGAVVNAVRN